MNRELSIGLNAPGLLSETEVARFFRDGYIVAARLVPPTAAQQALEAFGTLDERRDWQASIFDHHNPDAHPRRHRLLVEPDIVGSSYSKCRPRFCMA